MQRTQSLPLHVRADPLVESDKFVLYLHLQYQGLRQYISRGRTFSTRNDATFLLRLLCMKVYYPQLFNDTQMQLRKLEDYLNEEIRGYVVKERILRKMELEAKGQKKNEKIGIGIHHVAALAYLRAYFVLVLDGSSAESVWTLLNSILSDPRYDHKERLVHHIPISHLKHDITIVQKYYANAKIGMCNLINIKYNIITIIFCLFLSFSNDDYNLKIFIYIFFNKQIAKMMKNCCQNL